jgi:hypothetical protein
VSSDSVAEDADDPALGDGYALVDRDILRQSRS